ncbi:MAG: hypothetical protein KGO50_01795 [Myxococcales bacterium]|nr:hypothetical protein [Myxococcales bacterium]
MRSVASTQALPETLARSGCGGGLSTPTLRLASALLCTAALQALSGCATADLISPVVVEDEERDTRRDDEEEDVESDADELPRDVRPVDTTTDEDTTTDDTTTPDIDDGDSNTPPSDTISDTVSGDIQAPDADLQDDVAPDTTYADVIADAVGDTAPADVVSDVAMDALTDAAPDIAEDIVDVTDTAASDVTDVTIADIGPDTDPGHVTPTLPASVCGRDFGNTILNPVWGWDSGTDGWTLTGGWGRNTFSRRSGTHGMDTNNGATYYSNDRSDRLTWSSSTSVTNCASCPVTVSFWLTGETETTYDGIRLQCSPDGGASWTNVSEFIDGYFSSWTRFQYTLPASCLTSNMRLGFLLTTDDSVTYEGYFIDDVDISTTATRPNGYLDSVNAAGVTGWACDGDSWSTETFVRLVYFRNGGSESLERLVRAADIRADVGTAGVCGGTSNHGYNLTHDTALLDWLETGTHTVRAYALDAPDPCGAGWRELTQSPRTFTR